MTADLKPYPATKDSCVDWLGAVPTHWDVIPNRAVFEEAKERGYPDEQMLSVTINRGIIRQRALLADSSKKDSSNEDKSAYKLVLPGDIAYNKMRAWQGAIGASEYRGIVSPAYVVQRPHARAAPRYLHYLLRTPAFAKEAERWSYGITSDMWSLRPEHFKLINVCLPPLDEQLAIVSFLDSMHRRIRRFIGAKQRLSDLLEEQKQAIIHQAITCGFHSQCSGDTPAGWKSKRLKWVTRLQRGYDLPADRRVPGPYPVVSSGGMIDTHSESRCAGPGVVMGRYGSTDAVFFVEQDFWPHNTSLFVTDFQGNLPKWCYYLLRTIAKADHAEKAAVPGIDRKDLFQIVVAVPPVDEQPEIVSRIETDTHVLDQAIDAIQRQVSLVIEYWTRLVFSVSTGKLDVRDSAARLLDRPGESAVANGYEMADHVEEHSVEMESDTEEVAS